MEIKFEFIGFDELAKKVAVLQQSGPMEQALAAGEFQEMERIITASRPLVPVRYGILRSTGHAKIPTIQGGRVETEGGYGGSAAPYARAVHENPRAGRTGGLSPRGQKYRKYATTGQWKYLEEPWLAWLAGGGPNRITEIAVARVREAF